MWAAMTRPVCVGAVTQPSADKIAQQILDLVHRRGAGKTICPSEVARAVSGEDWRVLMPKVRMVVAKLALQGRIDVMQKGQPVSAVDAKGPIRLGLPLSDPDLSDPDP